jgi:hypothetical protein
MMICFYRKTADAFALIYLTNLILLNALYNASWIAVLMMIAPIRILSLTHPALRILHATHLA